MADIIYGVIRMDIAKLSVGMAEAKVMQGVQVGMLKRAMDQMEQTGAQIAEMLRASEVTEGSTVDVKI